MLFALMFLATAPGSAGAEVAAPNRVAEPGPAEGSAPAVRLWLNSDRRYRPGEGVKVQVETGTAGYLLVLQYDPDQRIRVLFPRFPDDDQLVLADRRYEVRDEDQGRSFVAAESGPGLVYAAISRDPFRFDEFVSDGQWNYGPLSIPADTRDPEQDLTALVQRMSSSAGFDYDLLDYYVGDPRRIAYDGPPPPSWWSPAYYVDPYWYDGWDPYYSCFGCYGYGSGFHLSIGIGSPSWYWPSYWYRPWYYSYYSLGGYYAPYWGYRRYYYGGGPVVVVPRENVPVIVGRPRGYTVGHLGPSGVDSRARPGFDRGDRFADGRTAAARPPARRARPIERSRDSDGRGLPAFDRGDRGQSVNRPSTGSAGSSPSTQSGSSRARSRGRSRGNEDGTTTAASTSVSAPVYAERENPRRRTPLEVGGDAVRARGVRVGATAEPVAQGRSGPVDATRSAGRSLPVNVSPQRDSRPRAERVPVSRSAPAPTATRSVERGSSRSVSRASPPASRAPSSARASRAQPSRVAPSGRGSSAAPSRAATPSRGSSASARSSAPRSTPSRSASPARGSSKPAAPSRGGSTRSRSRGNN